MDAFQSKRKTSSQGVFVRFRVLRDQGLPSRVRVRFFHNNIYRCAQAIFARRRIARELFSDNTTDSSREIKTMAERLWDDKSIHNILDDCSQLVVKFHFIPPRSPYFGGL